METFIRKINKLQDVFSNIGCGEINLPQIVVVGTQNSGKSSVLESLIGKSFLPKGIGIVTRVPLILQITKHSRQDYDEFLKKTGNALADEWAIISDKPDEILVDFDAVQNEIERRTHQIADNNKCLIHEKIVLKVYTHLYNLTFVDLPGMTTISVDDQQQDFEQYVVELILHYVEQPNSIILVIISANEDLYTNKGLIIARKMDPYQTRTIVIITKVDLVNKCKFLEIMNYLSGPNIQVKFKVIGVVNRNQEDINRKKSIEEALKSERQFLKVNYPNIYKRHGHKSLVCLLQQILTNHIKEKYPELQKQLYDLRDKLINELNIFETPVCKVSFVLKLLKDISISYCKRINGRVKLRNIIQNDYLNQINDINPTNNLTTDKIKTILNETNKSLYENEKIVKKLITSEIQLLLKPSLTYVENVYLEMLKMFDTIDQDILEKLARFPQFNRDVRKVFKKVLDETLDDVQYFIKSFIETYQENIDLNNSNITRTFLKCVDHNDKKLNDSKKNFSQMINYLNDIETDEDDFQTLIQCYFDHIRSIVGDFVPKHINRKMLQIVLTTLESRMHQEVFVPYMTEKVFDQVLFEEESVKKDHRKLSIMLKAVHDALKTMIEIKSNVIIQ